MIKLTRTGIGTADVPSAIRDRAGSGLLPIQLQADTGMTVRIMGRVCAEAPWVEVREAQATTSFLESISYCPELRLEVTAGTGTAILWIGEN